MGGAHGLGLFLTRHSTHCFREAKPDDQDVAMLEGRSLVLCDGLDFFRADSETGERRVLDSFGIGVAFEVD